MNYHNVMHTCTCTYAGPQSPGGATVIPDPNIDGGLTVIWMEVHLIVTLNLMVMHWTIGHVH